MTRARRRASALVFKAILPILATLPLSAQAHFPTSEDLRHLGAISNPQLSPDGIQVLYTITESTADGGATHLWLSAVSGGEPRQLTRSPESDKRGERGAKWAPDGSAIFFLAHRGEQTQLFRLPMTGGEAMPLDLKVLPQVDDSRLPNAIPPADPKAAGKPDSKPEPLPISVSGYAISPDGRTLAIWAADPETPGEKKAHEAKADANWVNHEHHGTRLYLAVLKPSGAIDGDLRLASIAPNVVAATWSPIGDGILVVTDPPNELSDLGPAAQAWHLSPVALDKPIQLAKLPGTIRSFNWRADGLQVVFTAQTPEDAPPGVEDLFALDLSPDLTTAIPRRLTGGFLGGLGYGDFLYRPDGLVLAPIAHGTRLGLATIDPAKAIVTELSSPAPILTGIATNAKQTGFLWLTQASDQPETLCFATQITAQCQPVAIPPLAPAGLSAVKSQVISWKSDNLTIEGLLYLPTGSAKGKVPLIVDVHGGPLGAWEDRYDAWAALLVGRGYAILRPNPRGSSAYGVHFAAANKNDLGGGDFRDVMAGVDAAIQNFPIDSNRLALMGYSYGGEMAGFAEGKTNRFRAIISGAPVIDQFSEYGTEGGSWYDRWYFGKPWRSFADAWRQSPLATASQAKTPFLLLQGESDATDPLGQSLEMYRALRQDGVPVELVSYPREDHGPLARGIFGEPVPEPWHGFDARQHILDFLEKAFTPAAK